MVRKSAFLLMGLSVALNLGFAGVWAAQTVRSDAVRRFFQCPGGHAAGGSGTVWCPLHRELGVTNEQWQRLEPRLAQFHQTAQAVCRQTQAKRAELVDLIAAGTDRTAIAARQEEILAGQRRMQELVIEQLRAEKEVLTAEQQRKLFDMIRAHSGCTGPALLRGGLGESSQTSAGNDQ
jgi:Spy/CpxP family protein refolding chaperone